MSSLAVSCRTVKVLLPLVQVNRSQTRLARLVQRSLRRISFAASMVIHSIERLLILLKCLEMTETLLLLCRLLWLLGRVGCQSVALVIIVVQGRSIVLTRGYLLASTADRDVAAWWRVLKPLGWCTAGLLLRHHTLQLLFLGEAHVPQGVITLHRL